MIEEVEQAEVIAPEIQASLEQIARIAEAARNDFNLFANFVGTAFDMNFMTQARIHREWQAHFDENKFAGIVAPQGHGKSCQMILKTLWLIGRNPDITVKLICSMDQLAVERVQAMQQVILNNKRYQAVFPWVRQNPSKGDWSKTSFTVARNGQGKDATLRAFGVLSKAAGGRADLLIFDDIVEYKNAILNPETRPKVYRAFHDIWMKMLHPDGRAWYISTLWHPEDVTHKLMASKSWSFLTYAIGPDFEPIWPERWSREALMAARGDDSVSQASYDRGFRNMVRVDGESPLDQDWLKQIYPVYGNRGDVRITGWDFAVSKGSKADFVAAVTMDVFPVEKRFVFHRCRTWKGLTLDGITECMREVQAADQSDVLYLEDNVFQILIAQAVNSSWGLPVETWTRKMNKTEQVRLQGPWFQKGCVWFTEETRELARRFGEFPSLTHDDDIDAGSSALKKGIECLRGGMSTDEVISSGTHGEVIDSMFRKDRDSDEIDVSIEGVKSFVW